MKYVSQFLVIMTFVVLGELVSKLSGLPISGGILGMIFLFLALVSGVVKVEDVDGSAKFMLEIMPMLFIAPAVGILSIFGEISDFVLPIVAIVLVSYTLTALSIGRTAKRLVKHKGEEEEEAV